MANDTRTLNPDAGAVAPDSGWLGMAHCASVLGLTASQMLAAALDNVLKGRNIDQLGTDLGDDLETLGGRWWPCSRDLDQSTIDRLRIICPDARFVSTGRTMYTNHKGIFALLTIQQNDR